LRPGVLPGMSTSGVRSAEKLPWKEIRPRRAAAVRQLRLAHKPTVAQPAARAKEVAVELQVAALAAVVVQVEAAVLEEATLATK
jgi:hypothetical protein